MLYPERILTHCLEEIGQAFHVEVRIYFYHEERKSHW